jgi:hypothetical protein
MDSISLMAVVLIIVAIVTKWEAMEYASYAIAVTSSLVISVSLIM